MGVKKDAGDNLYGTTLDPTQLKGNVDLQIHLHTSIHSKSKKKFEKSRSIQKKKINKGLVFDDFNIKLPDEEIVQRTSMSDSKDQQKIKDELARESEKQRKIDNLLNKFKD